MSNLQLVLVALAAVFVGLFVVSPQDPRRAFAFARWVLIGLASVAVLAPFWWLVAAVFKDKSVLNEYLFFPPPSAWSAQTLNFENFRKLFAGRESVHGTLYFWQFILNSTVYATVSTCAQLFFASLAGYALAKYEFRYKWVLMTFMLGTMMIPGALLIAPVYELAVKLRLVDSLYGLIVPSMVSAYGIFLFRQACLGVPDELIDAGRIDGCSEFTIYYRLVMPLVRPMAAAFCLVSFVGHWNAFFGPSVWLHSDENLTLPVVLNMYVSQYQSDYGVFLAGTALAMIPPGLLFFALQKEFISGLTSGAVKG